MIGFKSIIFLLALVYLFRKASSGKERKTRVQTNSVIRAGPNKKNAIIEDSISNPAINESQSPQITGQHGLRCNVCGAKNPPGAKFCDQCGSEIRSNAVDGFCPNCGGPIGKGMNFCEKCGAKLI